MLATITVARATLFPISGKPNYKDLLRLRECLTPILLRISYNIADGNHNLWEILSSDAVYKAKHHDVFDPPTWPFVYLIIPDYATFIVRSCAKTVQKLL